MKSQLCWSCKSKKCPWRQSLKPVDGWTATPTVTEDGLKSYSITKCPLYEHWDKLPEEDLRLHKDFDWDIKEIDPKILSTLSQTHQDVLNARFVLHLSQKEMAKRFGMSCQTVARNALHRAIDAYDTAKYKSLGYNISLAKNKIRKINPAALARCPKEFQKILVMKYCDGLSFDEMLSALGMKSNAFCRVLKKAKRRYFSELVAVSTSEVKS